MADESPKTKKARLQRNTNVNIVSSQEYVSPKRTDDERADGSKVVSKRNSQTNVVMSDFVNEGAKKHHPSAKLMPTNLR